LIQKNHVFAHDDHQESDFVELHPINYLWDTLF
jgi:hypothetical protein